MVSVIKPWCLETIFLQEYTGRWEIEWLVQVHNLSTCFFFSLKKSFHLSKSSHQSSNGPVYRPAVVVSQVYILQVKSL